LLFATIITLYVLPALYYMIERKQESKSTKKTIEA